MPVDGQEILDRLADVSITTWNYKASDTGARHISPMAQDFYAAFGVGEDNKHLSALDTNGVALAAIKALYAQNQALQAESAELQAQIEALQVQNAGLERRVEALEERMEAQGAPVTSASTGVSGNWLFCGGLLLGGLVLWQRRKEGGVK